MTTMHHKRFGIWGAGDCGRGIGNILQELGYELKAYFDGNSKKWGEQIGDVSVFAPKELCKMANQGIDVIIIGVDNQAAEDEIFQTIGRIMGESYKNITLWNCKTARNFFYKEYMIVMKEKMVYQWNVDFLSHSADWLNNIDSEVRYWQGVCTGEGGAHDNYLVRARNKDFTAIDTSIQMIENDLVAGDVVVDLGCGLITMYGACAKNGRLRMISMDPLAPFYNRMNHIYLPEEANDAKACKFGMFEFVDSFLPEEYANCVIINNALDHCIDPYRSIVKCMNVLRVGGILHLSHRRAEAVYEGWQGLHKWNVDYNSENELILWNKTNAVNISKALADVAQITLSHSGEEVNADETFVIADIKKICHTEEKTSDYKRDRDELAYLFDALMDKFADVKLRGIWN